MHGGSDRGNRAARRGPAPPGRTLSPAMAAPLIAVCLAAAALLIHGQPSGAGGATQAAAALRTWGFDLLRYLPGGFTPAYWVLAALLVLGLASNSGRRIIDRLLETWGAVVGSAQDPRWRRRTGDVLLPLLLVALCWLLRSRYALLGDNWLRLDQALRGERLPYEWGTMVLAHGTIRLGDALAGLTPRMSLAAFNTLAALPFGVAAALLARALGRDARGRGLVHLGMLGLGGIQLFCGYVEVYSWAFAVLALYLASALRALERGSSPAGPVVLFVAAVGLHAVALPFALPLLVLLGPRALRHGGGRLLRPMLAAVLLGALLLPLLARPLVYPYVAPAGRLSLLSPALGWERVNAFVLASPAGALLGLPLLAVAVAGVLRGRARLEGPALLLLSAALPVTLVLGVMKAVLGGADWDILAFTGLPLMLWAAAAATPDAWPGPRWTPALRSLLAGLVVISLCNSWAFVAVNAGNPSVQRVKDLIGNDPAPYYVDHPAPLHLAFLFELNNLNDEMYAALEDGVRRYGEDPRMAHNLASAYFRDGDLAQAKRWAHESALKRPGYIPPIHLLFLIAEREQSAADVLAIGEILLEIESQQPELVARYLRSEELARIRQVMARSSSAARPDASGQ